MIRVRRKPPPPFFSSEPYREIRRELHEHFRDFDREKRRSRYEWQGLRTLNENLRDELREMSRGKCAFCESLVEPGASDVEHYRPKRGARGFGEKDGESTESAFHDTHYWWLAFDWDNLLIVCPQCKRFKAGWFPLADESKRAQPEARGAELEREEPLLLDPCRDDPAEHLRFDREGSVRPLTRRGKVTIDILNLNRGALQRGRAEAWDRLQDELTSLAAILDLEAETGSVMIPGDMDVELRSQISYLQGILDLDLSLPYLGCQRQLLVEWLGDGNSAALAEALEWRPKKAPVKKPPARRRKRRKPSSKHRPLGPPTRGFPVEDEEDVKKGGFSLPVDDEDEGAPEVFRSIGDAGPEPEPPPPPPPSPPAPAESAGAFPGDEGTFESLRYLNRLTLEKIQLHNFKNIADLTLEVPQTGARGGAPWLLFLGENGVGKSSILQAIVLTLLGDTGREATGFGPDDVLRFYKEDGKLRRCEEGFVRIWISETDKPLELIFRAGESEFEGNVEVPGTYLLAYGSTRLLPQEDLPAETSPGKVRVRNLFKPSSPLVDASRWLFDLYHEDPASYDMMIRGLRRMLLLKDHEAIAPDLDHPEERRMVIERRNETAPLDRLSDGYRTILALTADLMHMLRRDGTSMEEAEGIAVIDEVGANLHPGWKKRIVGSFREVFPRIQFIVTTHEPLCLRGIYESETTLLRRDYDDKVVAVTNLPNPAELRVDELLASEFFGLSSTLESDVEEIYAEYYRLLTAPNPSRKQQKRRDELKEELRQREHLGHGLRDELMYEVIDKLLAEQLRSPAPKSRPRLKKEALEKVLESWKESGLYDDYLQEGDP